MWKKVSKAGKAINDNMARAGYEIMLKKKIIERGRPQMTNMVHAHCMLDKATQHITLIAFPLQRCLHERASMLRYTILPVMIMFSSDTPS